MAIIGMRESLDHYGGKKPGDQLGGSTDGHGKRRQQCGPRGDPQSGEKRNVFLEAGSAANVGSMEKEESVTSPRTFV